MQPDSRLEIAGHNEGSNWWLVAMPNGPFAWVPDALVTTLNVENISNVTTPSMSAERVAVFDTVGYQALAAHLLVPPTSMSFSPDGEQIAVTERIKVYTVATEGGSGRV